MKTIENKTTTIVEGTPAKALAYVDLLKLIMNVPPKEGYTISEMKQRLDIYAALVPDENNQIKLEDALFEVVKACVNSFKWGAVSKDIVDFVEYLNTL